MVANVNTFQAVADAGGLCIEVRTTGAKCWRYRYRYHGKANMIPLGEYPTVSLQDARRERDRQRSTLNNGVAPADVRRQARVLAKVAADDTFEVEAREWLATQGKWRRGTREKSNWLFNMHAFPWTDRPSIGTITVPELLVLLRR